MPIDSYEKNIYKRHYNRWETTRVDYYKLLNAIKKVLYDAKRYDMATQFESPI